MNIIIMVITAVLMYCVSTLCWGLYHPHSFWSSELSSKVGIILFFSKWEKHALRKWIIFPKVIQLVSVHRLTHALWSLSPPVMSSLSMETQSWIVSLPLPNYILLSHTVSSLWNEKETMHLLQPRWGVRKELSKEFLPRRSCLSTALPIGRVSKLCFRPSVGSEIIYPFSFAFIIECCKLVNGLLFMDLSDPQKIFPGF